MTQIEQTGKKLFYVSSTESVNDCKCEDSNDGAHVEFLFFLYKNGGY